MSQETLRADRAVASSTGQRLWSCLLGLHVRQAERRQLEIPRGKLSDGNPLARARRIRPAETRAFFFRCRFEVSIQGVGSVLPAATSRLYEVRRRSHRHSENGVFVLRIIGVIRVPKMVEFCRGSHQL